MSVPKKDLIRRIIGWEVLEWSSFILDINLKRATIIIENIISNIIIIIIIVCIE